MFKIGDFVVKPNTGICKIKDVVYMSLSGKEKKQYYMLMPLEDTRSVLYVSIDADRTRLRPIMTKEDAQAFISKIKDIDAVWVPNDKIRDQQYKSAFQTNEPEALVAVIKNLNNRSRIRLAQGKKITLTDERYFKQAEKVLYTELSISLGIEIEDVEGLISETIET